ncbi:MAG: hypothetical protein JOZ38_02660 [Candidatus Eremiobacteraeota bacterium]|nr:hypothetical protein [Candidatus Eremiobacteraeota bacterium]
MKDKLEAVYELRDSAEQHGRAQAAVERSASSENVRALIETRNDVDEKTTEAIEACHHCGRTHSDEC